jgi:hypothetical protein
MKEARRPEAGLGAEQQRAADRGRTAARVVKLQKSLCKTIIKSASPRAAAKAPPGCGVGG